MSLTNLTSNCQKIVEKFNSINPDNILLLHHNDCDGLTSGTILSKAFERQHIKVHRYCLEKPYPIVLKDLFNDPWISPKSAIFLVDFGAGMFSTLSKLNVKNAPIFVIDHHRPESVAESLNDSNIHSFNCIDAGLKGDNECSASGLAYIFASQLDKDNIDLLSLGLLGALGDGQPILGLNEYLYNESISLNQIKDKNYFLEPHNIETKNFIDSLNGLGSFAYFNKGPDIAVKGLSEGFNQYYQDIANKFISDYQEKLNYFINNLKINNTNHIDWFILPDEFNKFGVKTVGLVCEELLKLGLVKEDRYLAGFQSIPNTIPGIGPIQINQVKISMRIGKEIYEKYKNNQAKGLNEILPPAIIKLAGFVDACHPHAGAATIKTDQINNLITELEKLI
jgi:single-stranded-DNA-specific exonuclease